MQSRPPIINIRCILLLFLLLCPILAYGQASPFFIPTWTINSAAPQPGQIYPMLAFPSAPVSICATWTIGSGHCTTLATTYTSTSGLVSCPSNAQLVNPGTATCSAVSDTAGGISGYALNGVYAYVITTSYGTFGPFPFTVNVGGVYAQLDVGNTTHLPLGSISLLSPACGAKGDGVTDDTTAVQTCITYAVAHHMTLYVPPASVCYLVTKALNASNPGGNQAVSFWLIGETPAVNGNFVSSGYSTFCHALTEAYPVIDFGGDVFGGIKNMAIIPVNGVDSNSQATAAVLVTEGGVNEGTQFTLENNILDAGATSTTAALVIAGADQTTCRATYSHSQGTGIVVGGGFGGATSVTSKFYSNPVMTNNTQYVLDGCGGGSSSTSPSLYLSGSAAYMFSGLSSYYSSGPIGIELNDAHGYPDQLSGYGIRFEGQLASGSQLGLNIDSTIMGGHVDMNLSSVVGNTSFVGIGGAGYIDASSLSVGGGGAGPPTFSSFTGSLINSTLTVSGSWGAFGTLSGSSTKNSSIYSHGTSTALSIIAGLSASATGVCVWDETGNTHTCNDFIFQTAGGVMRCGNTLGGFICGSSINGSGAQGYLLVFNPASSGGVAAGYAYNNGSSTDMVWLNSDHTLRATLNGTSYRQTFIPLAGIANNDVAIYNGASGLLADAGYSTLTVMRACGSVTFAASTTSPSLSCAWVSTSSHCSATWSSGSAAGGALEVNKSAGSLTLTAATSNSDAADVACSAQ